MELQLVAHGRSLHLCRRPKGADRDARRKPGKWGITDVNRRNDSKREP